MPLKVNTVTYSSADSINKIASEIKKLSSLKIIPVHEKKVESSEAILCLQREVAYVDQTNPITHVRYIGSKDVKDCLLLYLYNETDHLVVHVDNTPAIVDLYPFLEKFKYKNGIKAILAGGMIGERSSASNLEKCIRFILEAVEKLNIDIEIVGQNIIEKNQFDVETDRYQFLFDFIMTQANLLSKIFYRKNLDFEKFKDRSANDLKDRIVVESEIDKFYFCLNEVSEFMSKTTEAQIKKALGNRTYGNFESFIDKAVSKTGIELVDDNWIKAGIYKNIKNKLVSFVFDMQDPTEIIVINKHLSTFYEPQRKLVLIEQPPSIDYFLAYDGVRGEYNPPKLSSQMEKYFEKIRKAVAKEDFDIEEFEKITATEFLMFNYFEKCELLGYARQLNLAEGSRETVLNFSNCSFKFFNPPIYLPEKFFSETILKLNQIWKEKCSIGSHKFIGKMRRQPQSVLDALLLCNNESEVVLYKALIDELLLHIKTKTVAYTLKLNDEKYYICVPAVNVSLFPTTGTTEAEEDPSNIFN